MAVGSWLNRNGAERRPNGRKVSSAKRGSRIVLREISSGLAVGTRPALLFYIV